MMESIILDSGLRRRGRERLEDLLGQRLRFRAVVGRLATRVGWHATYETTLLLERIATAEDDAIVADHVWLVLGRRLEALDLRRGDVVEFYATVRPYRYSFRRRATRTTTYRTGVGLAYPTRCAVIARAPRPEPIQPPEMTAAEGSIQP